jgi:hypothetical protein
MPSRDRYRAVAYRTLVFARPLLMRDGSPGIAIGAKFKPQIEANANPKVVPEVWLKFDMVLRGEW